MEIRDQFAKAFELLGRAFESMQQQGLEPPVLVGGGAVEFYTSGAVNTGDFDIVTTDEPALEAALLLQGFRKEDRAGHLLRATNIRN